MTFSLIALDPNNRLRYPPVSLFFMMCLCLQIARLVQENLFRVEFVVIIGRMLGAKFACLRNHEMTKFWPDLPFPKGYANFGGPAGGCSLRARCPLMAGTWLVETVLLYRQSKSALGPGRQSSQDDGQKIREIFTFSFWQTSVCLI